MSCSVSTSASRGRSGQARRPTSRRSCAPTRCARACRRASGLPLRNSAFTDVADVGLEALAGLVEALLVEELVVPLAGRILGLGIDRAVDQRHHGVQREARREIGHAEARHADRLVGMMRGHVPDHRAAPVVADPHRLVAAERGQQLEHVVRRSAPARNPRGARRCSSGRSRACRARCSGSRAPRRPAAGAATRARARASHGRRSAAARLPLRRRDSPWCGGGS